MRGAVIDLGSNSVRLMVVEWNRRGSWRVVDEERHILRLGETLLAEGRLFGALERATFVLSALVKRARKEGATRFVAVGTAAIRSAPDGAAFVAALERAAGVRIRIIDGQEEARLGFIGVRHALTVPAGYLVDLGGASTELSGFEGEHLASAVSIPVGAVTLAGRMAEGPEREAVARARQQVSRLFGAMVPDAGGGLPLVVIGGSFRSLARVHRAEAGYPFPSLHNYRFHPSAIGEMMERISRLKASERPLVPGLTAHRSETALAALVIAEAIVAQLRPSEIVVSGTGVREGLLYDRLLPRDAGRRRMFEASVLNLLFQFGEEVESDLTTNASRLWEALSPLVGPPPPDLVWATAALRGIGKRVNWYDRHLQTSGIIMGARLFGVAHRQQIVLAAAAGYMGPRLVREMLLPFPGLTGEKEVTLAQRLGLVAALAEGLTRKFPAAGLGFFARNVDGCIEIGVEGAERPPEIPFDEVTRLSHQFGKVFGRELVLRYQEPVRPGS